GRAPRETLRRNRSTARRVASAVSPAPAAPRPPEWTGRIEQRACPQIRDGDRGSLRLRLSSRAHPECCPNSVDSERRAARPRDNRTRPPIQGSGRGRQLGLPSTGARCQEGPYRGLDAQRAHHQWARATASRFERSRSALLKARAAYSDNRPPHEIRGLHTIAAPESFRSRLEALRFSRRAASPTLPAQP